MVTVDLRINIFWPTLFSLFISPHSDDPGVLITYKSNEICLKYEHQQIIIKDWCYANAINVQYDEPMGLIMVMCCVVRIFPL